MPDEKKTEDPSAEKPEFVTSDQLNKAITARLENFAKSKAFTGAVGGVITETMTPFMDELKLTISGGGKKTEEPATKTEPNPEIEKARKEAQAARARADEIEGQWKKDKDNTQRGQRTTMLQAALAKAGVKDPSLQTAAAKVLETSVKHTEDGRVVFERDNKYGTKDEVDVETAVADWAKSDGKAFVAARDVKGSGNLPGGRGNPGGAGKKSEKMEIGEAKQVLSSYLSGLNFSIE